MKASDMQTLRDVHQQLNLLASQVVCPPDNTFRKMEQIVARALEDIDRIELYLTVPAAEYVPAIGDAFTAIDDIKKGRHD